MLGPPIEKWVAHEPDNPDALDWRAWLNEQRELIRKADPRTYAGRKLPDCLTRLLRDRWRKRQAVISCGTRRATRWARHPQSR